MQGLPLEECAQLQTNGKAERAVLNIQVQINKEWNWVFLGVKRPLQISFSVRYKGLLSNYCSSEKSLNNFDIGTV